MAGEAGEPQKQTWVVQYAHGGIPEEPALFDNEEAARRVFVECAVAEGISFTEDCNGEWIGNDEDEIRMWGPIETASKANEKPKGEWVSGPTGPLDHYERRALNETERAEVDRIRGLLAEERRAQQEAREVAAELRTPGGGCD